MKNVVRGSLLTLLFVLVCFGVWKLIIDQEFFYGVGQLFFAEDKERQIQESYQLQSQNIKQTLNKQVFHHCKVGDANSCGGFVIVPFLGSVCPDGNACIYRDFGDDELFWLFPLPKQTGHFKDVYGRPAKEGNASFFYRDVNHNANERIGLSTGYSLTGLVSSNIQTLELFWDGHPYRSEQVPINTQDYTFRLEINFDKGNLRYGENNYLLRGNSHGMYYERLLRIFVYNPFQDEIFLQSIENFDGAGGCFMGNLLCREPKFDSRYQFSFGSGVNKYVLSYRRDYLGKQSLMLTGGGVFSYQKVFKNGEEVFSILFTSLDGKVASLDIPYTLATSLHKPELLQYSGGYLLLRIPGWESSDRYFLYSSKKNLIQDVDLDFVRKSDGDQAFPIYEIVLDVPHNQLILKEYPYCCDELFNPRGYEVLRYDLDSGDLLDRSPIKDLKSDGN